MESNNLTTRIYTAPTCQLLVLKESSSDLSDQHRSQTQQDSANFTLYLDHPDRGELDRITLAGHPQQLDYLQQIVSKYITELVSKFPLPIMNNTTESVRLASNETTNVDRHDVPDTSTPQNETVETSVSRKLYPNNDDRFTQSGLMNNLPGLRDSLQQSTSINNTDTQPKPTATAGISKIFGGWTKHKNSRKNSATTDSKLQKSPLSAASSVIIGLGQRQVEQQATSMPATENGATAPSLTKSSGSLDHQLNLGNLATKTSGDVVTLSAIQLFDLSTVLDEYATDGASTDTDAQPMTTPVTLSQANIPGSQSAAGDTTSTLLSRLPNLPTTAPVSKKSQVYRQSRNPRTSLMSVIPWAAAAAVAVGLPLLLLDSKPNPLKDAASKVKMPDLEGVKKSVTAILPRPEKTDEKRDFGENTATAPNANSPSANTPAAWQTQPVTPPQVGDKPLNAGAQTPQTISKIGIAPLPTTLVGKPGQDLIPTAPEMSARNIKPGILSTIIPSSGAQPGIAPNPLSSRRLPSERNVSTTGLSSTNPSPQADPSVSAVPKTTPGKTTILKPGKLTGGSIDSTGTVSVSKQPMIIPSGLPTIGNNSPSMPQQGSTKTVKQKVKPAVANNAKPKTVKSTGSKVAAQPLFEPFNPDPSNSNPNLNPINPAQPQAGIDGAEFPTLPTFPTQPLQSNNGGSSVFDPAETPSLQEAKRYFQGKWKATATQSNPLQYVIQVNGKSGIVRSVSPQGEAAKTYLQKTKLIKTGQKLFSSTVAGSADQKIRVVLQTDGNVDTFMEP